MFIEKVVSKGLRPVGSLPDFSYDYRYCSVVTVNIITNGPCGTSILKLINITATLKTKKSWNKYG